MEGRILGARECAKQVQCFSVPRFVKQCVSLSQCFGESTIRLRIWALLLQEGGLKIWPERKDCALNLEHLRHCFSERADVASGKRGLQLTDIMRSLVKQP